MNISPNLKVQIKIISSMYLAYGAIMVLRQMITILGPAMLADESLGLTKTDLGDFAAYGTIGALIGKLIWGPLTDKIGGRKTFLIGIVLTAIFVIAFGFTANIMILTIFSALIYCLKSSGWPALTKLIGNWFHPSRYGTVWSILSTSSRASVVIGTLFFGWLLSFLSWQTVAVISAGIAFTICIICFFTMGEKPSDEAFIAEQAPKEISHEQSEELKKAEENLSNHPLKNTNLQQGIFAFIKNNRFWLIVVMMMMLTCAMAFLDFVSIYLMEVYKLTPSNAAMVSSVFPMGSLGGLIVSIFFYDRFSKKSLTRILTINLAVATLAVVTLKYLPGFGLDNSINYMIAIACIFVFGFCISPAYYIPMSVFSIEFGGPHSATLVCLLDAFGFAASASFGFIGGRLADSSGGWDSFMNMIILIALISTLSVWGFMNAEYKASHKS